MLPHHDLKGNSVAAACAEILQRLFGVMDIFQILKVPQDGLARVIGLRTPGTRGQPVEALLDLFGEPDGKHDASAIHV